MRGVSSTAVLLRQMLRLSPRAARRRVEDAKDACPSTTVSGSRMREELTAMTAPSNGDWATVPFRKSSRSSTNGGQSVEVGARPGRIGIQDSKKSHCRAHRVTGLGMGGLCVGVAGRSVTNPGD
jgi:hypothetical protein